MNIKELLIDFINYCRDNHFMPILHDNIEPLADDYLHSKNDGKPPVSCRFYRGYTIRNHGYYPPDKCVWWEAVNNETGEADFHAKRLKDIISMINEALGVHNGC